MPCIYLDLSACAPAVRLQLYSAVPLHVSVGLGRRYGTGRDGTGRDGTGRDGTRRPGGRERGSTCGTPGRGSAPAVSLVIIQR